METVFQGTEMVFGGLFQTADATEDGADVVERLHDLDGVVEAFGRHILFAVHGKRLFEETGIAVYASQLAHRTHGSQYIVFLFVRSEQLFQGCGVLLAFDGTVYQSLLVSGIGVCSLFLLAGADHQADQQPEQNKHGVAISHLLTGY